ncbi:MAG: HupE/UreJ family protein [Rhodoferax sp.]|nr:MAG: HupE/UreJ family protein [Rhodoferax sp.]
MRKSARYALFFIAIYAVSMRANAHIGTEMHGHGSFMTGFLHPFGGMDHLLAMLAVGVWSALVVQRPDSALLRGPLAFANVLLLGTLLGLQGLTGAVVEPMVAASVLVLGLLVLTRFPLGRGTCMALVGGFALFHGLAHGSELAASDNALAAMAGMYTATLLLHLGGVLLGWPLRRAPLWVGRATGATVAASGVALLLQLV